MKTIFLKKLICKQNLLFALLLILLSALFFSPLYISGKKAIVTPDFISSDIYHGFIPLKAYYAQILKNKQIPIWTNLLQSGVPLMAFNQIGTFNLINILLFFPLPYYYALTAFYILNSAIMAIASFFLAKKLHLSSYASLFFALTVAFSAFNISHFTHLDIFHATCLIPLVLLLLVKSIKKPKFWPLFSLVLSQQYLAGGIQIVFITILSIAVVFLTLTFFKYFNFCKKKVLVYFFLACFLALTLSAIQFLPSIEYFKTSVRSGGMNLSESTLYPYPLKHIVSFINPFIFGNPKNATYPMPGKNWGIFWENTAYVGLIPIALILLFFLFSKKRKLKKVLLALFAIFFLLILGKNSPLYFVYSFFPFNLFHVPSRFLISIVFIIAYTAAIHLDEIYTKLTHSKNKQNLFYQSIKTVILLLVFINLWLFFKNYHLIDSYSKWLDKTELITFLQKQGSPPIYSYGFEQKWSQYFSKNGWTDPSYYLKAKEDPINYLNLVHGIKQSNVRTSMDSKRNGLINGLLQKNIYINPDDKKMHINKNALILLQIQAVKYFITPYELQLDNQNYLKFAYKGKNSYAYEINNFSPEVYFTNKWEKVDTFAEFTRKINLQNKNIKNLAFIEKGPNSDLNSTASANYKIQNLDFLNTKVSFDIQTESNGIVVLNLFKYPGWKAYIDDREVKILHANINQTALVINKGSSHILLQYKPQTYSVAKYISILSHIALLVYGLTMVRPESLPWKNRNPKTH